jgi:hypothetical protein
MLLSSHAAFKRPASNRRGYEGISPLTDDSNPFQIPKTEKNDTLQ